MIYPNLMNRISEKTIEVNLLRHLANCIEKKLSGSKVKIICPTPNQEKNLGFDSVLSIKKSSRVIAIQFKRPKMNSKENYVKFSINVDQQITFLNHRSSVPCKFYILSPFVNHTQFISKTPKQLLENSRAIYLQDMPNTNNIGTKTYTLTINTTNNAISYNNNRVSSYSVKFLCLFMSRLKRHDCIRNLKNNSDDVINNSDNIKNNSYDIIKKQKIGRTYYLKNKVPLLNIKQTILKK